MQENLANLTRTRYEAYALVAATFGIPWFLLLAAPISPVSAQVVNPEIWDSRSVTLMVMFLAVSSLVVSLSLLPLIRRLQNWAKFIWTVILFSAFHASLFGMIVVVTGNFSFLESPIRMLQTVLGDLTVIPLALLFAAMSAQVVLPMSALQVLLLRYIASGTFWFNRRVLPKTPSDVPDSFVQ